MVLVSVLKTMFACWNCVRQKNKVKVLCDTDYNGDIAGKKFINEEYFTGSLGYTMALDYYKKRTLPKL